MIGADKLWVSARGMLEGGLKGDRDLPHEDRPHGRRLGSAGSPAKSEAGRESQSRETKNEWVRAGVSRGCTQEGSEGVCAGRHGGLRLSPWGLAPQPAPMAEERAVSDAILLLSPPYVIWKKR